MSKQSAVDMAIESIAESQEISVNEAAKQFLKNSEQVTDFGNLSKQTHNWTDRGLKFTCENAGHPWHEAYKTRKLMTKA